MRFAAITVVPCVLLGAVLTCPARAQETSTQIWANLILALPQKSDRLYFEIDIEPKLQLRGDQKWANTDATALVEYYPFRWLDVTGELVGGFTVQNDDVRTLELTPKLGLRLHLASNIRELQRVGEFAKRIGLAILFRIEDRNFWYFGTGATESHSNEWRFRIRPEARVGINRRMAVSHPARSAGRHQSGRSLTRRNLVSVHRRRGLRAAGRRDAGDLRHEVASSNRPGLHTE
jgi:hypothetical protein